MEIRNTISERTGASLEDTSEEEEEEEKKTSLALGNNYTTWGLCYQ